MIRLRLGVRLHLLGSCCSSSVQEMSSCLRNDAIAAGQSWILQMCTFSQTAY